MGGALFQLSTLAAFASVIGCYSPSPCGEHCETTDGDGALGDARTDGEPPAADSGYAPPDGLRAPDADEGDCSAMVVPPGCQAITCPGSGYLCHLFCTSPLPWSGRVTPA